jgi:hypothetical protein
MGTLQMLGRGSSMKRSALLGAALVLISGCVGSGHSDAYEMYQANQKLYKDIGAAAEEKRRKAIAAGAMDPLDRAENAVYKAAMDLKHPDAEKREDRPVGTPSPTPK